MNYSNKFLLALPSCKCTFYFIPILQLFTQEHQLQSESRARDDITKQIEVFKTSTEDYKQQCDEVAKRLQYLSELGMNIYHFLI